MRCGGGGGGDGCSPSTPLEMSARMVQLAIGYGSIFGDEHRRWI